MRRPARCGCGGREPRHVYLFSTKPTARRVLSEVRSGRPLAAAQRRPDGEKQQKADRERSTARRAPVERTAPAERDVRRPFEADIGRARLRGVCRECPPPRRALGEARRVPREKRILRDTVAIPPRSLSTRTWRRTRPWTRRSRRRRRRRTRRRTRRRMSGDDFSGRPRVSREPRRDVTDGKTPRLRVVCCSACSSTRRDFRW